MRVDAIGRRLQARCLVPELFLTATRRSTPILQKPDFDAVYWRENNMRGGQFAGQWAGWISPPFLERRFGETLIGERSTNMQPLDRREVLRVFTATAGLSAFGQSVLAADEPPKPAGGKTMEFKIPESLKAEHEELHEELVRLTKSGGKTGDAARAVAKALHPHFVKEEELAMPPLGLLRALAEGPPRPEMAKVADLSDQLKKDLPKMLKEHEAIVGALEKLAEAGKQENHPQAGHFAEKLKMHAKTEEEVLYPAGILVGEYIKLKLGK